VVVNCGAVAFAYIFCHAHFPQSHNYGGLGRGDLLDNDQLALIDERGVLFHLVERRTTRERA
jgi:hypothetical protein